MKKTRDMKDELKMLNDPSTTTATTEKDEGDPPNWIPDIILMAVIMVLIGLWAKIAIDYNAQLISAKQIQILRAVMATTTDGGQNAISDPDSVSDGIGNSEYESVEESQYRPVTVVNSQWTDPSRTVNVSPGLNNWEMPEPPILD